MFFQIHLLSLFWGGVILTLILVAITSNYLRLTTLCTPNPNAVIAVPLLVGVCQLTYSYIANENSLQYSGGSEAVGMAGTSTAPHSQKFITHYVATGSRLNIKEYLSYRNMAKGLSFG
jgi:hypothetical protein